MGELSPAKWKERIDRSLKPQKEAKENAVRFQRAYGGDYNEKATSGLDSNKDEATVNFIFSYLETTAPTVFSGDPKIFLQAMDPDSEDSIHNLQAVVNHWFRTQNFKKHLYQCRWDSYFGHAGFLSEWDYEDTIIKVPRQIVNPFTGQPVHNPLTGQPMTMGTKNETKVLRDRPLGKRLNPWDIILDIDSDTRMEDRWRGLRVYFTKDEFDALPGVGSKMKNKVKTQEKPRDYTNQPFGGSSGNSGSGKEFVILTRIYDVENDKILLLPDCGDSGDSVDFVEEKDWPYDFEVMGDRFPVTLLEARYDAQNPYGFPDFKAYWNQIQEKNRFRTMLQSHIRRMSPGWFAKKGAMDEEQKKKFLGTKIGEYTEANNPDGIKEKPMPKFPNDFFVYNNVMSDDLLDVSGFAEYRNDSIADTATESSILEGRSKIRKGEKRDAFMDFVATIGGKTGGLCQQFQTIETASKITNPKNPREMIWIHSSREEIQGQFLYTAKPGVQQQSDEGMYRQQMLKLIELMSGNKHADQRKLAEKAVQAFDHEPEEILRPMAEIEAEDAAASQPPEEKPKLGFDKIKFELLPPEIQSMVLHAAMGQNEVAADESMGGAPVGGGAAPAGPAGSPASLQNPTGNSVMPGTGINQAPAPTPEAGLPPATPVQPISESQGG